MVDFNTVMQKHLTLKKQKKHGATTTNTNNNTNPNVVGAPSTPAVATESNLKLNRGPPPQPPISNSSKIAGTGKSSPPAVPPPPIQLLNEGNTSSLYKRPTGM